MLDDLRLLPFERCQGRVYDKSINLQWHAFVGLLKPSDDEAWLVRHMATLHQPMIDIVSKDLDVQQAYLDILLLERCVNIQIFIQSLDIIFSQGVNPTRINDECFEHLATVSASFHHLLVVLETLCMENVCREARGCRVPILYHHSGQ